jgi:hypothetical protein
MWRQAHRGRRRQGRRAGARLLLLLGTPGTGKRALGHYLAEHAGFVYLDFADSETRQRFLDPGLAELRARLAALGRERRGLVISWEAGTLDQLGDIGRLRGLGFEPLWFDSDRGSACGAHFAGARPRTRRFRYVEAFDRDGRFRALEAIAREIATLEPRVRLAPRVRVSPRLAMVAAAAVAAAAGVGAAFVALVGPGATPARQALAPRPAAALHATPARPAALPQLGVLVSGRSLAGVALGVSAAKVRALWGDGFTVCESCRPLTWLYFLPNGDPVGAGVEFRAGHVVGVFTLGSPAGWRTETGIRVGDILGNPRVGSDRQIRWETCSGFGARSSPSSNGQAVTSILTQGAAVYGFALTRPSVSPCA